MIKCRKQIKKHPYCYGCVFLLLAFILSYNWELIPWIIMDLIDRPNRVPTVWYPVNITEENTLIVDYKTTKDKYKKCFELGFERSESMKRFGYTDIFESKYFEYSSSMEEFHRERVNKPRFIIHIYRDGQLIDKNEVYMMYESRFSGEDEKNVINNSHVDLAVYRGIFASNTRACYDFKTNIPYQIAFINTTPFPNLAGIETFIGLNIVEYDGYW